MNPSTTRAWALVAAGLMLGGGTAAAQTGPPITQDWEFICDDPCTTNSNFSVPYNFVRHRNDLFGYYVGTIGTVAFECFEPTITLNTAGRIGFQIGRVGSIQDVAVEGQAIDDDLMLTFGMPYAVSGNAGYAKIVKQAIDTGALTLSAFAQDDAMDSFWTGASDRYSMAIDRTENVEITLRTDLIGDAARLTWTLENLDANQVGLGLWFGQWVTALGPQTGGGFAPFEGMSYVRVPGLRPLKVDQRFARNPNSSATPRELSMPSVVDFGISQSRAFGLQIINLPTETANSALADQTPVDVLDIGDAGAFRSPSLLGPQFPPGNTRPMSPAYSELWDDVFFIRPGAVVQGTGYIQKWNPQIVGNNTASNRFRTIVAYYKSTTGNSDYAKPYSAVVDAPRTVAVRNENPFQFNPAVSTVRVYIDNTRGFSTVNQSIPLNDVRIQLDLPQGMSDASDPTNTRTRIVRVIDRVDPNDANNTEDSRIAFVDFQVRIDPTVYGTKFYTVTIEPQPGARKVITGSINVASQPQLLIRPQANLVTAPWQFADTTWGSILGGGDDPLQQDVDYQAFTWDAQRQEYVLQTGPQRGKGTFIVSSRNVGFKELAGSPRTPDDLAAGAPLIVLKPGWNLIANPYNYPIEIGQIVGVTDTDPTQSYTFEQLAGQGVISASLAYWDPNQQSYKFTTDFADQLLPNLGYWIFVTTTRDVTISFPPVFTPFIPTGTGGITRVAGWKLNMVARTKNGVDDQNFLGVTTTQAQANKARIIEPPIAPVKGAIRASFAEANQRLAMSVKAKASKLQWNYAVTPREGGTVTLTWPNINEVPATSKVTLIDPASNMKYDLRQQKSFAFFGQAGVEQQFQIVVEEGNTTTAVLSNVGASTYGGSATVRYALGGSAKTSVRILQSGREIVSLSRNRTESAGQKTLAWNLRDAANRRVRAGVYVAEVTAEVAGNRETKTVSFLVR